MLIRQMQILREVIFQPDREGTIERQVLGCWSRVINEIGKVTVTDVAPAVGIYSSFGLC
jgi:hypothetical protein